MSESAVEQFKNACREYLLTVDIYSLRAYGREIGLAKPTKVNKEPLVEKILLLLSGEMQPQPRSNRGAPPKNSHVDPQIPETIEKFRREYLCTPQKAFIEKPFPERYAEFMQDRELHPKLEFRSKDDIEDWDDHLKVPVYRGQLQSFDGVSVLLPLNCMDNGEKIVMPIELIRAHDLREGDVVSCVAQKGQNALVVSEIRMINEISVNELKRGNFETDEACYPHEKLLFATADSASSVTAKYVDWLLPVYKGQRGLILSAPKAGKTELVFDLMQAVLKSRSRSQIFVLLNAQSPETVGRFRKAISEDRLVYTTYDEDPERQVFAAEYLLKRAKRFAESGEDVLLLVDSLNGLARAYNDTEASSGGKVLAGGLESKTLQFLRKYFGSARCFEKGGSLTMLATVSVSTGNPADDLIGVELCNLANHELRLDEKLARKRVYPTIDLLASQGGEHAFGAEDREEDILALLRERYLPVYGEERLRNLLVQTNSRQNFSERLLTFLKD